MQEIEEMWVPSLGREDSLEEGRATHSSILAWRIPWREDPGGLQSLGSQRVGHDWKDLACMHTRGCVAISAYQLSCWIYVCRVVCSVPLPSFPLTTGGKCFIFPLNWWYSSHDGNCLRVWVKDPKWETSTQEHYSFKIRHHVTKKHVTCLILQKKRGIFKSV